VLSMAAIAAVRLEKLDKALAYIQALRKTHPDAWETIYCETIYYAAMGDNDKTLQSVHRSLKLWPDKPEPLTLYANIAPEVIGLPAAIDELGRLCSKGKSSQCRLTLAGLLETAGRNEEALEAIKLAIRQDSKRMDLYHYLASFYVRNHMTSQALKEYEDILNKKPDDLKAATLLALIHHDAGHIENAVKVYNYILNRDPDHAIASNNLAWIIANETKRPDLDRALQLASKAKDQFPDNPRIADTLGYVYLKKGLYANAQAQFSSALEHTPNDPMINYHMALALAQQGRQKDAVGFLKKALSTEEKFSERDAAQRLLSDLSARKS
ncbi:MAG TPA: tetratricopeptide repeat protein, partial [Deltaproteobacteria bacterium]|nr:tetratricopeptide repeat protein [Deltaproteobacteria bacterium]